MTILSPKNDDKTLPIINKTKHPKKREGEYIQGIKRKDPIQEDKRTTKRGQTTKEGTSSSGTPSFCEKHIK